MYIRKKEEASTDTAMTTCFGKAILVAFSKNWENFFQRPRIPLQGPAHQTYFFSHLKSGFSFPLLNITDLYCKTKQILGWEEKGGLVLYSEVKKNSKKKAHYCKGKTYKGRS